MDDKKLLYLIYPKCKAVVGQNCKAVCFNHLTYEVFEDREACRARAREVDMMPAQEWVVIEGNLIGLGLDEAIDFFEESK